MTELAIRSENLGKRYRLGEIEPYKTLRDAITRKLIRRPRHPSQGNLGTVAAKSDSQSHEYVWALRDLSFEIERGEAVGVIGPNGAGKTTLLKVLSRITSPTEGHAEIHGRVGSLLEVGTGFHPELTGRENVYLNGSVLGMRTREIAAKYDDIVAFAELGPFMDTPMKRFSSGMRVRLAFAVAAHLGTEIMLIDEVLAVGDAAFQRRCLGKMDDVATEGRTVLFVSHNMSAITRLCRRSLWLQNGALMKDGPSHEVVQSYLEAHIKHDNEVTLPADPDRPMRLRRVKVLSDGELPPGKVEMAKSIKIQVEYDVNRPVKSAHVICFIYTGEGVNVLGTGDTDCSPERLAERPPGRYRGEFEIPGSLLGEGRYFVTVSLGVPFMQVYDRHESVLGFEVVDKSSLRRDWQHQRRPGILGLEIPWRVSEVG